MDKCVPVKFTKSFFISLIRKIKSLVYNTLSNALGTTGKKPLQGNRNDLSLAKDTETSRRQIQFTQEFTVRFLATFYNVFSV